MFHQPFYPQPPPPPTFHNSRGPNNFFIPVHSYYNRPGSVSNRSSLNLNFTRDFEHFSMPQYGFPSAPSGAYSFYDVSNQNYDQHRWRFNMTRGQQQNRSPPFYFQDKSTFYYMSDPIVTNDDRITIQLTKVYIGPNGDQQRVFVEQEFSNENELNNFVRNFKHNFKKTFNNRATGGVHSSTDESQSANSKKAGVIVVEEPDEEPKIYPQEVYNENIQSKFEDREQCQRSPRISSCSTVRSNKHQRNKMKYRRQKVDNQINQEEEPKGNGKSSRIFPTPSYSRHYEPPPRFQQRFFNKENESRMRTDFSVPPNPNTHWRYNQGLHGYPHPLNNRSRSYVPPMSENIPPPPTTPSRFHYGKDPFFRPIHPPTPPRFTRTRDQSPSRFRRSQQQHQQHQQQQQYQRNNQQSRPRTIAENLIFTNNKQQQPPVHRTRSDCRQNVATRCQSKSHEYLDFGPNLNYSPTQQRHFIPGVSTPSRSVAPIGYPQRRLFQNTQAQIRLFNPCRLGSNRF